MINAKYAKKNLPDNLYKAKVQEIDPKYCWGVKIILFFYPASMHSCIAIFYLSGFYL